MMRASILNPGKFLKQSKPLERKTPMPRGAGFQKPTVAAGGLRVAAVQAKAGAKEARESKLPKARKAIKSRGMKGRPPTAEEARFMDAIAGLGCIACRKDGLENLEASVHHIRGRTAPGAHFKVLGLCAGHHQKGTGNNPLLVAVHPDKAQFEEKYGTQLELLAWSRELLGVL